MTRLFGEIDRRTVAQTIVDQVKDLVRQGKLQPGQKLPSERELSGQLGVGRSSVREATSAMLAMGIIEIRPGEGAFIRPDFPQSLLDRVDWSALLGHRPARDLIEARFAIEVNTARLAARRARPEDHAALRRLVERMAAAPTVDDLITYDLQFHLTLAEASQNPVFRDILAGMQGLMRDSMRQVLQDEGLRALALEQHRRLCAAVERGAADEAEAAIRAHLDKDLSFFGIPL